VRVWAEGAGEGTGIPCVRGGRGDGDGWVGGLNGLLKFNYPFGEE
jgi:NADH kinase